MGVFSSLSFPRKWESKNRFEIPAFAGMTKKAEITERECMDSIFIERLVLEDTKNNIIYNEHLIRYELAKRFAAGKRVLDIACGSGYGAKILAEAGAAEIIAADIDKKTLELAAKNYFHPSIKYLNCGAEKIELEDKTMDLAVSLETIEHLPNQDLFLTELRRVLKDDGLAIISTPNREVSKNKNPFHIKELNKEEFLAILNKYFSQVYLWEQTNGIATVIAGQNETTGQGLISISAKHPPEYFIALCSSSELPAGLEKNMIVSVNPAALAVIRNNPILKLADKFYPYLVKVSGIGRQLFFTKK